MVLKHLYQNKMFLITSLFQTVQEVLLHILKPASRGGINDFGFILLYMSAFVLQYVFF